jgi:Fe2+ transport system protein B
MPDISRLFDSLGIKVFFISAFTGQGLSELTSEIMAMLERLKYSQGGPQVPVTIFRPEPKAGRGRAKAD